MGRLRCPAVIDKEHSAADGLGQMAPQPAMGCRGPGYVASAVQVLQDPPWIAALAISPEPWDSAHDRRRPSHASRFSSEGDGCLGRLAVLLQGQRRRNSGFGAQLLVDDH